MEKLAEEFRRKADEYFGARRNRSSYPEELRELARRCVGMGYAAGMCRHEIARMLGIAHQTAEKWSRPCSPVASSDLPVLRSVRLLPQVLEAARSREMVVRGPAGIVVEGLDVPGLAELITALA